MTEHPLPEATIAAPLAPLPTEGARLVQGWLLVAVLMVIVLAAGAAARWAFP